MRHVFQTTYCCRRPVKMPKMRSGGSPDRHRVPPMWLYVAGSFPARPRRPACASGPGGTERSYAPARAACLSQGGAGRLNLLSDTPARIDPRPLPWSVTLRLTRAMPWVRVMKTGGGAGKVGPS